MYVINKKLEDIEEKDLQHLIDEEIIENKILDYKLDLTGRIESEKKKFLANISSFANASGGDIIFGVKENRDNGKPEALIGIEIENVDQELLRLDQLIRDGIEPNIPSSLIKIQPIKLSNSKYIIIIRINKSWLGPHRVSYKAWDRFYSRSTNGKYRFDVQELKSAFILSETIGEKIKQFREKRISAIYANQLPIPFYESPKIVLHFIPLNSFSPGQRYDLKNISLYDIQPLASSKFSHRYNIDGLLTYSSFQNNVESSSYVQLFRNSIIEVVNSELLWTGKEQKLILINAIEKVLVEYFPRYMNVFKKFDINSPVFFFLTLIGVKDYKIPLKVPWRINETYPIDRDLVLIPEIMIEHFDFEPSQILKPIFDSIWNACGYERSFNYTKEGKWDPPT